MKKNDLFGIAFMLFAIFFGAGNMIFPPQLGSLGGSNWVISLIGFIIADVALSVLGVIVVAKAGDNLDSILNIISPKFAVVFTFLLYLMIGPLFAIPRTCATTYEFIFQNNSSIYIRILFSLVFFAIVYFLSINPSKIVTIVGKILTPFLVLSIVILFAVIGIKIGNIDIAAPQKDYISKPLIVGIEKGYLAMDGIAALVFATLVIKNIKNRNVKDKKSLVRLVVITAIIAGLILSLMYFMLAYIGSRSTINGYFDNGADLLVFVTNNYIGVFGRILLVIAVSLACLTTAIGLTTSMSTFIVELNNNEKNYKKSVIYIVLFSALISIVGLNTLLKVSIPVLVAMYPLCILIIFMGFFKKYLEKKPLIFTISFIFVAIASIVHGFDKAKVVIPLLTNLFRSMPFYTKDFGYLVPGLVGILIGFITELFIAFIKREVE